MSLVMQITFSHLLLSEEFLIGTTCRASSCSIRLDFSADWVRSL
jgi:hypothetical protein